MSDRIGQLTVGELVGIFAVIIGAYKLIKYIFEEYASHTNKIFTKKQRENGLDFLAKNANKIVIAIEHIPNIKQSVKNLENENVEIKDSIKKQKDMIKESIEERRLMMSVQETDLMNRIKNGQNGNSEELLKLIREFKDKRIFHEANGS